MYAIYNDTGVPIYEVDLILLLTKGENLNFTLEIEHVSRINPQIHEGIKKNFLIHKKNKKENLYNINFLF